MTIVRVKSKPEAEREGVKAIYAELRGEPYKAIAQDHQAWTDLKKVATVPEIEARWRIALDAGGWARCNTIWELSRKWNDVASLVNKRPSLTGDTYPCELCRARVEVDTAGRRRDERGWLCADCFNVGRPTEAETEAHLG